MCKKICGLLIVWIFALAVVSAAEEKKSIKDNPAERADRYYGFVDREQQRQPDKFDEMKERIEKLCVMAREAEEKAKRFWAEAEELERALKSKFVQQRAIEPIEKMHAKVAELEEAAERAEREGHHDKSAELHEKAGRLAEEIEAQVTTAKKRKPREAEERLERMENMAREAEERGETKKAKKLRDGARKIELGLRRGFQQEEMADQSEKMRHKLAELKEAAGRAKQQGRHDEAAKLREEARELAAEIEATSRRQKVNSVASRIEQLHAMAREAKEAGQYEKAEAIFREAKELEHNTKNIVAGKKKKAPEQELVHQIEMLREQVNRLRKDVERLEDIVRRNVMNR